MGVDRSISKVQILVVIGVATAGHRTTLVVQAGGKESATTWRELFKEINGQGLDASQVVFGIMHGLPGVNKVFLKEFPC